MKHMNKDITKNRQPRPLATRTTIVLVLSLCVIVGGISRVNAHNIDVVKARDKAREYAKKKVDDPNRAYQHFSTDCLAAFPGHNHIVRCSIFYFDDSRNQLCKERIEAFVAPHEKTLTTNTFSYEIFIRHTSTKEC
jgi:hypothetical protein